jgi:hypothetical protein
VARTAAKAQPDSTTHITLGQSAVPLYGPWKFTVGDSPIDPRTGQPLWAEPDFDDSKWETVDLTPKDGAFDPGAGLSGYVPGWTAKGHPGSWGYAAGGRTSLMRPMTFWSGSWKKASQRSWSGMWATRCGGWTKATPCAARCA